MKITRKTNSNLHFLWPIGRLIDLVPAIRALTVYRSTSGTARLVEYVREEAKNMALSQELLAALQFRACNIQILHFWHFWCVRQFVAFLDFLRSACAWRRFIWWPSCRT